MNVLATITSGTPVGALPVDVVGGNHAVTSQDFTSLNCKRGVQFEASTYIAALAAGGTVDYIVEVGAVPILIKGREIQFSESGVRLEIWKTPVYTGGTPAPYFNLNKWSPVIGSGVIKTGMTITSTGTKVAADRTFIGGTTAGNTYVSTPGREVPGLEMVLEPGAKYLFRTVNTHTAACRYSAYTTWYEGLLDVQQ